MPKHINSANRLNALLTKAIQFPDNGTIVDVWAEIFEINETNVHKKSILVSDRIGCVYRELEIAKALMQSTTFSAELYSGAFTKIEHAVSTLILNSSWNNIKQYLDPTTLNALAFCIEILPDEENEISLDDLNDIKEKVQELHNSLDSSELPPRLYKLIKHHVNLIERAISEYPISGAKAFREVAYTGLGELIEVKEDIQKNKDDPQISKLSAIWKKVNEVTDMAIKADSLAQLGQKAWALLENML